jgi:hypothetical protein
MRELMRKKRAGKRKQAAPADTADKAATPADGLWSEGAAESL